MFTVNLFRNVGCIAFCDIFGNFFLHNDYKIYVLASIFYFFSLNFLASKKNSGKIQPLLGCGKSKQACGGSFLHCSSDITPNCDSGLLHHSTVHDGVSTQNSYLVGVVLMLGKCPFLWDCINQVLEEQAI